MITAYQHPVTFVATDLNTYHSVIIGKAASLPYGIKPEACLQNASQITLDRT